ncbi:MAG: ThuA domain-containing protein [Planctomycetes bacterium]|nr:ThuA domain-containing protein [Planctomycetota bacterium]
MIHRTLLVGSLLVISWSSALCAAAFAAEPAKKLLVVTVTTGFRHGSIPVAEKTLAELGEKSGAFSVDFVREPRPRPQQPKKPQRAAADTDETFKAKESQYQKDVETWKPFDAGWQADVAKLLAERMSLDALKPYDGVIFANTTGDLPLPDKQGFIDWLRSGKAFIGMHSATDTFHNFRPYIDMIGGEFDGHPWHQLVTVKSEDSSNPVATSWGSTFEITDEIYQFKSYSRDDKQVLMSLDATNDGRPKQKAKPDGEPLGFFERGKRADRDYAVAWVKPIDKGRVFYTSLGHRDEVWRNPQYQQHVLAGIRWALDAPAK